MALFVTIDVKAISRAGWTWSEVEIATHESVIPSVAPEVAIDSSDNLHLVWEELTGINYAMRSALTETWSSSEIVSVDSLALAEFPSIVIDKSDNIHTIWQDNTDYFGTAGSDYDICHSMKAAESSSWTSVKVISTESTGDSEIPEIACDSNGNLHVVYWDETDYLSCGVDKDIFYKKWSSSSSTWGVAEVVSTESDDESSNPQICVADDGHIYVVWTDDSDYDFCGTDRDIFFKHKPIGEDWSTTVVLSWLSDQGSTFPSMICENNGRIHVVWADFSDILDTGIDWDILYCMYAPILESWTNIELVSEMCDDDSGKPDITIDKFGDLHIAWHDPTPYGSSGSDWDILYRIKEGVTGTWSQTFVVSTDNDGNSFSSKVITDSAGYVNFIWQDDMEYLGDNYDYDMFYRKLSGPIEEAQTGIFQTLDIGEIIVLAAIVGGFQVLLVVITYLLLRRRK